jgi:hypothetical protein
VGNGNNDSYLNRYSLILIDDTDYSSVQNNHLSHKDAAMKFSIIYSVDVPRYGKVSRFTPPHVRKLWDKTEGDEQYDFNYLQGEWKRGHHRKWCAILTKEQFEEFVSHCGLTAESTETMGSLGAPGFGFGWSPAISFRSDDCDAIQSAYVTPLPETRKQQGDERDWRRIRQAVLSLYG